MKYSFILLVIPLLFSCSDGNIEIESTNTDESTLPETLTDFSGVYHFGDSEMETDLLILKAGNTYYAQIKSGDFNASAAHKALFQPHSSRRIDSLLMSSPHLGIGK